jgi:hypothetical protein
MTATDQEIADILGAIAQNLHRLILAELVNAGVIPPDQKRGPVRHTAGGPPTGGGIDNPGHRD